jgi:hypothetical protein
MQIFLHITGEAEAAVAPAVLGVPMALALLEEMVVLHLVELAVIVVV